MAHIVPVFAQIMEVMQLPEVQSLKGVPAGPEKFHGNADALKHSLMAMECAAGEGADDDVVLACGLHDLGKALTPKDKWPHHYGHDRAGILPARSALDRMRI